MNTSNGFQEDGPIHYTKFSQTDFPKKVCQGFRKKKMLNGGRGLFAFLNLRARIKIRVSIFDTNHSVTDSTQTINRCFDPEASWFCGQVNQHSPPQTVDVSDEMIRLSIILKFPIDFLHVTYIKYDAVLVFNFTFDLLWTGGGSAGISAAFL